MTIKGKDKLENSTLGNVSNLASTESDNIPKNILLLRDLSFFIVVITTLLYMSAYVCEVITAFYYGYDPDLISLSMSTIIKNNIISLSVIILSLLPIIFDYLYGKKGFRKPFNQKKPNHKNRLIFILITVMIIGIGFFIFYKINEASFFKSFLPSVMIALLIMLFLYFFLKSISSREFKQLLCYLSLLFFLYLFLTGLIFLTFTLLKSKSYQAFDYNKQSYVLLRQYDDGFIANKIIQKEQEGQKKNYLDHEILYLPTATLDEGLFFRTIRVLNDSE